MTRPSGSVFERFGQIDLLINNAGVFQTANFEDITAEQWDEVFAVNVRGPFLVSQRCIPSLRSARGRIINMGSLGGAEALGHARALLLVQGGAAHADAGHGQVAGAGDCRELRCARHDRPRKGTNKILRCLERLAAHTPMKKNGTPQDVVSAVMYFATAPHFITGQVLTVDGGLGLR